MISKGGEWNQIAISDKYLLNWKWKNALNEMYPMENDYFLAVIMRWVPPLVRQKRIKTTQEVCGKFLYTARAMDITTLHALNELCIAAIKGI